MVFEWLGLAADFKCPAELVVSMGAVKPISDLVGNPMGVAYNPLAGSSIVSPMNFVNPIINFLGLTAITIVSNAMAFFVFEWISN